MTWTLERGRDFLLAGFILGFLIFGWLGSIVMLIRETRKNEKLRSAQRSPE